jgi:putative oxidoreductase
MLLNDKSVMACGRVLMGLSFLYFGLTKLLNIHPITGFIGTRLPMPGVIFWLAVILETACGLALCVGYKTRWVAAFLAFYCVFPTAMIFHTNFAVMPIRDHFFSNLVMAAGFLYVCAAGPGAAALDNARGELSRRPGPALG